jgi:hypothetical protein
MTGSSLQAQHPLGDRLYPALGIGIGTVFMVIGAFSDRGWALIGAVGIVLGLISLWRVLHVWTIIDASGWYGPHGSTAREAITEIVLFRGTDRRADFFRTSDGARIPIVAVMPAPWTLGAEVPPEATDLFCRLQHDVAHDLGWEPVPIRVDLGPGQARASFVHLCDGCTTPATT